MLIWPVEDDLPEPGTPRNEGQEDQEELAGKDSLSMWVFYILLTTPPLPI